MAEESSPKWEGRACVELAETSAQQVWPLLEDFCNIHKWMPLDTCYQVEGVPGQPGLIRYCASTIAGEAETTVKWAKEKLLALDPLQRCFTYEVVDNNIGLKSYVATIKVLPSETRDKQGCKIEWSFVSDQVEGWGFQDLISHIEFYLHSMANKMQLACSAT